MSEQVDDQSVRKIELTQGKFAIIDADDYDKVSRYKWCFHMKYAATNIKRSTVHMHTIIMGRPPSGCVIDHVNGIGTDNRKSNLRICTQHQNLMNRFKSKNYEGSNKGIHRRDGLKKVRARIYYNGKERHLGYFDSETEAAAAYNKAAKEYFGDFAKLNKI